MERRASAVGRSQGKLKDSSLAEAQKKVHTTWGDDIMAREKDHERKGSMGRWIASLFKEVLWGGEAIGRVETLWTSRNARLSRVGEVFRRKRQDCSLRSWREMRRSQWSGGWSGGKRPPERET